MLTSFELLESRTLYASAQATVSVETTSYGTMLSVQGGYRNDIITTHDVTAGQFILTVNGRDYRVLTRVTKHLHINGNNGDDTVILNRKTPVSAYLIGGRGNDRLEGGRRADTIFGGDGNDTVAGNGDLDYLDGGTGDDVFANDVTDVIHGGSGTDRATGGILFNLISGVEGAESPADGAILQREHGRLMLDFEIFNAYGGDYSLSPPQRRASDGQQVVTLDFTPYANGASGDTGSWQAKVDVTDIYTSGLLIQYNDPTGLGVKTVQYLLPQSAEG